MNAGPDTETGYGLRAAVSRGFRLVWCLLSRVRGDFFCGASRSILTLSKSFANARTNSASSVFIKSFSTS